MKKTDKNKPYVLAKLYNRKGDLSKRWYVQFQAWNEKTGELELKRVVCPAKFATKKERNAWGAETVSSINELLFKGYRFGQEDRKEEKKEAGAVTLKNLLARAIEIKSKSVRKKSLSAYTGIKNKLEEFLGIEADKGIEVITKKRVADFQDFLLKTCTPETTNDQLNKARILFTTLKNRGLIKENNFEYEKLIETEGFANMAFSDAHLNTIEEYLINNNYPLYLYTRIIYYNFIRPGELRQLKKLHFDLKNCTITVPGGVAKSRKNAVIPMHPRLISLLEEHKEYPDTFYMCGKGFKPGSIPLGTNAAYEAFIKVLKAAGLEDAGYTLYSWKHTGVVRAYEAGTDIKTLQFLLRHESVETTEIYLKSLRLRLDRVQLKNW